jgi:hypothetical protein
MGKELRRRTRPGLRGEASRRRQQQMSGGQDGKRRKGRVISKRKVERWPTGASET